jgi:acetyl esterase/lipase
MKPSLILGLLLAAATTVTAANPPLPLWPKEAPGEKSDIPPEQELPARPTSPALRITNVTKPTLTVFPAPADKATGAAVVICPGGGYGALAFDKEGTEIAQWLNTLGVTGIVLKYRVPARKGLERHTAPLQDAQRALGLVRQQAKAWNLDPKRIGILGFSAGGHLAAALSNNYEKRTYPEVDAADKLSCRPDFAVLIYPAYLTVKAEGDKIAPELPVTKDTPPTFLVQTGDDGVRVESSLFYYLALKNAKVPVEMHLYPKGGHGYGMRPSEHLVSTWPQRTADWMKASGYLK